MKTIVSDRHQLVCCLGTCRCAPQTRKHFGMPTARSVTERTDSADTKMGKTLNAKDLTDPKVQSAFH